MKFVLQILLVAWLVAGCTTKSKSRTHARAAFLAGQRSGVMQSMPQYPSVIVRGEVRHPIVPWSEGLSLAQAIVLAEYHGEGDPVVVIVTRNGEATHLDARQLLQGNDYLLQSGDVVELRR